MKTRAVPRGGRTLDIRRQGSIRSIAKSITRQKGIWGGCKAKSEVARGKTPDGCCNPGAVAPPCGRRPCRFQKRKCAGRKVKGRKAHLAHRGPDTLLLAHLTVGSATSNAGTGETASFPGACAPNGPCRRLKLTARRQTRPDVIEKKSCVRRKREPPTPGESPGHLDRQTPCAIWRVP